MDQNDQGPGGSRKLTLVVIVLIIGGLIGFWLGRKYERKVSPKPSTAATEGQPEGQEGENKSMTEGINLPGLGAEATGGNTVLVEDQATGNTVAVKALSLVKDGWVAIHRDSDGKPAGIMGAQRFNAGKNQTGTVDLLSSTEEGKVYYAMLHDDDDGDHKFDRTKDLPVKDAEGNPIMVRFVATAKTGQ